MLGDDLKLGLCTTADEAGAGLDTDSGGALGVASGFRSTSHHASIELRDSSTAGAGPARVGSFSHHATRRPGADGDADEPPLAESTGSGALLTLDERLPPLLSSSGGEARRAACCSAEARDAVMVMLAVGCPSGEGERGRTASVGTRWRESAEPEAGSAGYTEAE